MKEQDLYQAIRTALVLLEAGGQSVLKPFDLTLAQYDALQLLSRSEGQRMGELGKRLLCDNSKVTRIIDHLVARGLVERRLDPMDRRSWHVTLLPAGEDLRDQVASAHRNYLKSQFSVLTPTEQERLTQTLARLQVHLQSVKETDD